MSLFSLAAVCVDMQIGRVGCVEEFAWVAIA